MADRVNITIEAQRRQDEARKKKSRAENVRRALARWKANKGSVRTQARLQEAGFNFANMNPGQAPQPPSRTVAFHDPGRPLDPRAVAAMMQPVVAQRRRKRG